MTAIRHRRRLGRFRCLLALCLLPALLASPAAAYDLMIDNSGSMGGFESKLEWRRLIDGLRAGAERAWSFGDRVRPIQNWDADLRLDEQGTLLGAALQTWLAQADGRGLLVMLTDNVADAGDSEAAASQQLFYDLLTGSRGIGHLAVIPFRLPFSGRVYHPSVRGVSATYGGERALALYLVAQTGFPADALQQARAALARVLPEGDRPYVQMIPFARRGWDDTLNESRIAIRASDERNSRVVAGNDGVALYDFSVGERLDFAITAAVRPGPDFRLNDVDLFAEIAFEDAPHMQTARPLEITVTPNKTTFNPGEAREFTLAFAIRGFELLDLDFPILLDLALQGSTMAKGHLSIHFEVKRENVNLVGELGREWDYDGPVDRLASADAEVQKRIYRLQGLLQRMIPPLELSKPIWARPVWIELKYPIGPLFLALIVAALLLAGAVFVAMQMARGSRYMVYDDAGNALEVAPSFTSRVSVPSSDGVTSLRIRNFGLFHLHSSPDRLTSSRLVSPSRADAQIETRGEDGTGERYRFRVEKAKPQQDSIDAQHEAI